MPGLDLRKEQIALLRTEKLVISEAKQYKKGRKVNRAAIAASVATLSGAAASAAAKLGDGAVQKLADEAVTLTVTENGEPLLIGLAEVLAGGHAELQAQAAEFGMRLLEIRGLPKRSVLEVVQSVLGLG